jgi:hypothetical protein
MHAFGSTSIAVSLPGGVAAEDGEWLREAELRALSGQEEDWLIRNSRAPSVLAVTFLLRGCLVSLGRREATPELIDRLLVGDREFLILQLRRITLGEEFTAVVSCPACSVKMDTSFRAEDVPVEHGADVAGPFSFELQSDGRQRRIHFRLPTGTDQEAVLDLPSSGAGDALLKLCLLDDGGMPLNDDERSVLSDAIERCAPKVELELDLTCPSCRQPFVLPFDTTAFFLQELRSNDRNLLQEFHSLAFHYHWSQTEILGIDRERRRKYLSLLTDELQRD